MHFQTALSETRLPVLLLTLLRMTPSSRRSIVAWPSLHISRGCGTTARRACTWARSGSSYRHDDRNGTTQNVVAKPHRGGDPSYLLMLVAMKHQVRRRGLCSGWRRVTLGSAAGNEKLLAARTAHSAPSRRLRFVSGATREARRATRAASFKFRFVRPSGWRDPPPLLYRSVSYSRFVDLVFVVVVLSRRCRRGLVPP